jgi:hypothetical protein
MGIKNLGSFSSGLDRLAREIDNKALLAQKKLAFLVLGAYLAMPGGGIRASVGVLQLTPVDTGRAVGNWQVSLNSPADGEVEIGGKAEAEGGNSSGNRSAAEAKAQSRAASAITGAKFGGSIWICNNLPYIVVLNDGGVNRVAHHMVERAIANARAEFKGN